MPGLFWSSSTIPYSIFYRIPQSTLVMWWRKRQFNNSDRVSVFRPHEVINKILQGFVSRSLLSHDAATNTYSLHGELTEGRRRRSRKLKTLLYFADLLRDF